MHLDRPQMTTRPISFASWIIEAKDMHSEFVMFVAFHGRNCVSKLPHFYVIRILPIFLVYVCCCCNVL
jgi:hypothetical protein